MHRVYITVSELLIDYYPFLYLPQAMPGSTRAPYASPAFQGKSRNGPWGDVVEVENPNSTIGGSARSL